MSPPSTHKLSECASRRHLWRGLVVGVGLGVACGKQPGSGASAKAPAGSAAGGAAPAVATAPAASDSARAMAAAHDTASSPRLGPAGDSLAPYLVFVPRDQREFVAAGRNKQVLLDVGRVDIDLKKDTARARIFREIAPRLSPVPPQGVFRLAWSQGAEDVVADSFAVYNGRLVMRLFGSPALDSVAMGKAPLAAYAVRADSASAAVPTSCELRVRPDSAALAAEAALTPAERKSQAVARKSADSTFDARVAVVRDSLEQVLRLDRPPYERLQRRTKLAASSVRGCFGAARRALLVSLRAGDAEWVREKLVLIAPDGAVTTVRVADLRFRAHDLLTAFDADGDGVDDLATRATTERAGATTILRVDLTKKRAERLAAGFAWEVF